MLARFYLLKSSFEFSVSNAQNIDGGNSLDSVRRAVPKFVRSIKIPEKRNERIRYTGRIAEKILERAVRIGRSVITVPATNATSVTMTVYKIT